MENKISKNIFKVIGIHSANIFFVHSFIYYYYSVIATPFNMITSKTLQYIILFTLSFILSIAIETLKKILLKKKQPLEKMYKQQTLQYNKTTL